MTRKEIDRFCVHLVVSLFWLVAILGGPLVLLMVVAGRFAI